MKKVRLILLIACVILVISGCTKEDVTIKEQYAYTFRLAESHPEDHITTQADYYFAELVEKKSAGRMQVVVYDNKQLGEEKDVIEQVQFGAIDFARVSTAPLSEFVPRLNVIQLPYLYTDGDHMWRVLESDIGDMFLSEVSEEGFIGFAWMDAGARSFYNKEGPIETIEDLHGLRIRTMQSTMMTEMIEALGAQAIAMPYGEIYSSMQTGLIDGAENNWSSYETATHYEVAPYYSLDEHVRVPEMLIGSSIALDYLNEEDLAILYDAAGEAQEYQRRLWQEKEVQASANAIDNGAIVNRVDNRTVFYEAVLPLYDKYAEGSMDVVEAIQAMSP